MIKDIAFTKECISRLFFIIYRTQSDDNLVVKYTNKLFYLTGKESRVYIRLLNDELQIAYMKFKHKHIGAGTLLLEECIEICEKLSLSKIVIETACTKGIVSFCEKFNFKKSTIDSTPKYVLNI